MSADFVRNTLTRSESIELYTPYDVTSPRPRKTTIAFFSNFGGIEKLFCVPDVELKFQFTGIKKGAKISFHRHFNLYMKFPEK